MAQFFQPFWLWKWTSKCSSETKVFGWLLKPFLNAYLIKIWPVVGLFAMCLGTSSTTQAFGRNVGSKNWKTLSLTKSITAMPISIQICGCLYTKHFPYGRIYVCIIKLSKRYQSSNTLLSAWKNKKGVTLVQQILWLEWYLMMTWNSPGC